MYQVDQFTYIGFNINSFIPREYSMNSESEE